MILQFSILFLGLLTGSFINVVIYRLPRKESIIFPRSHCPYCGNNLGVLDLIPVVSYLFLWGKCRYCGEKISWQYPLVELVTGLLLLSFYFIDGLNIYYLIHIILIGLLIPIMVIDFKYQIIPNKITIPAIGIGFLTAIFFDHISVSSSISGLLFPGGFLLLLSYLSRGGMGMGDVKLAAMIGTFIGPIYSLLSIFIGAFLGMVYGIIVFLTKENKDKKGPLGTKISFGTFICISTISILYWGEQILDWYINLF